MIPCWLVLQEKSKLGQPFTILQHDDDESLFESPTLSNSPLVSVGKAVVYETMLDTSHRIVRTGNLIFIAKI